MAELPDQADSTDVTALLERWQRGDRQAFDRASAAIVPELRRIAAAYLHRERTGHTLQPTALVNEAFIRLAEAGVLRFDGRRQFFALAAQLMRRILVDHARAVGALKRGGGGVKVPLEEAGHADSHAAQRFLVLHDALERLAAVDPRKAQIIELRYFGGLSLEESAAVVGVSTATAHRDQRLAEAWLNQALSS